MLYYGSMLSVRASTHLLPVCWNAPMLQEALQGQGGEKHVRKAYAPNLRPKITNLETPKEISKAPNPVLLISTLNLTFQTVFVAWWLFFVYFAIYIYIFVCIYIYMYMCVHLYIYILIYLFYMYVHIYVLLHIHMYTYVIHIYILYRCLCIQTHEHISVCMHVPCTLVPESS